MGEGKRQRAAQQRDASAEPPASAGPGRKARNEVVLVGRVAAAAEERTLPSGDVIVTWRLVVDRPPPTRTVPQGLRLSTIDTFTCVAWEGAPRRTAGGLAPGDVVQVAGALRRRFWRTGAGAASLCEVEVAVLTPLAGG